MQKTIQNEFQKHLDTSNATLQSITHQIEAAARICIGSINAGGKILIFGNGGSAGDAQHIASELVGKYKVKRKGLAAIALSTDSSVITSIGNDFGFLHVFERQVEALANNGDVAIGISTGGTSENVINAISLANQLDCKTIGLSGRGGGMLNKLCDLNLVVPAEDTARIQEMHILIGHTICQLIDLEFQH
tara:strand:- start:28 stop:597 length:570 start_codon:yes stop_codon:yes gene_type:complete